MGRRRVGDGEFFDIAWVWEGIGLERALKGAFGCGVLGYRVSSNGRTWRGRKPRRPAALQTFPKGHERANVCDSPSPSISSSPFCKITQSSLPAVVNAHFSPTIKANPTIERPPVPLAKCATNPFLKPSSPANQSFPFLLSSPFRSSHQAQPPSSISP